MELLALTPSLQHYIFSFCDADALFAVSHVCRDWKVYAQQEALWFHLSRVNARRAACCTYRLRRGEPVASHRTAKAWSTSDTLPMADPVDDDPYAFIFGEAFASPAAAPKRSAEHQSTTAAAGATNDADIFQGLRLAEERLAVPLSSVPSEAPPRGRAGPAWWWPRMASPIPPPPWEASASHESAWTSLARAGDGGHGGVREFTMRFLRYLSFSLSATYPTSVQMGASQRSGGDAEEQGQVASTETPDGSRYVCGCYYCRFVKLDDARHPRGCQRSRDGIALISPNGFTLCLAPLRDRIQWRQHAGVRERVATASSSSAAAAPVLSTVWHTSFLRHFSIAGERGWQQNSGDPSRAQAATTSTGEARGFYVAGRAGSPKFGAAGWGADGSEGIVYPKELSLAFRVEWLPDTRPEASRRRTHSTYGADEADEDEDEEAAASGPSECIIGFIDRQDVCRYERAAVEVLAGRSQRAGDEELPTWLCPTAHTTTHAPAQVHAPAPWSGDSAGDSGGSGGGAYGAGLFQSTQPSPWGGGGDDEDDVEAEVASWLAATAKDIEARDRTSHLSSAPTGVSSSSSAPPPKVVQRPVTTDWSAHSGGGGGVASDGAALFLSTPRASSNHGARRSDAADASARGSGNGGIFVGDTPNGYGFAVRHKSWIHDRHITPLALNSSDVEVDWDSAFAAVGGGAGAGAGEESDGDDAGRTMHIVYRFHTEEDCVQLSVNGEDAGTVLVDAFSDGQVWVPAVSVKGARCAVTILPPEMVLYD